MKILFFAKEEWEVPYIKENLPGFIVETEMGSLNDFSYDRHTDVEVLSVFVNSKIRKEELDLFPNLKLIAVRSTGYDNVDVKEATVRGITVCNVPAYGATTVAEFAFALILALSRRVCLAHKRVTEENSFTQDGLVGFDLEGKTLGIIGAGRIGSHVAKIGNGFGMQVIAYDEYHDDTLATKVGFSYVDLKTLLETADIISVHAPYNEKTHHLINKNNISFIKKGAYLINTARGSIVETTAIVDALQKEILAGVGLDVLEEEKESFDETSLLSAPHPKEGELKIILENHYLSKHPRVIMTPHIAFNTKEAVMRIMETTVSNIVAFSKGESKNNVHV